MVKKLKRCLLLVTLSFLLLTTLTGCTHDVTTDAQVLMKWDAETISIYADKECFVEAIIHIEDAQKINLRKRININANQTSVIHLKDIASEFLTEKAEIVNVTISSPMESKLDWWVWIIVVVFLIIAISVYFRG